MASKLVPAVLALVLAAAGCGGDDGKGSGPDQTERTEGGQAPQNTNAVAGGTTSIRLNESLARLLDAAGASVRTTGAAKTAGPELRFPITGGELDPDGPSGVVEHDGGLRIGAAGQAVSATALQVDAGAGEVTGEVSGRRVPLFAFGSSSPRTPVEGGVVSLQGTLQIAPGSVLEDRLPVPLPKGGIPIGRIVVSANRPEAPGG